VYLNLPFNLKNDTNDNAQPIIIEKNIASSKFTSIPYKNAKILAIHTSKLIKLNELVNTFAQTGISKKK